MVEPAFPQKEFFWKQNNTEIIFILVSESLQFRDEISKKIKIYWLGKQVSITDIINLENLIKQTKNNHLTA